MTTQATSPNGYKPQPRKALSYADTIKNLADRLALLEETQVNHENRLQDLEEQDDQYDRQ